VGLAVLSAADLGVESESSLADVYNRARQVGLELCAAEVGPQLRLDYHNQPLGEALNIAMEPVATYSGDPTILALANFGTGLLLIGSDGRSEFMVPPTFRLVFALPSDGRLEALRSPDCPDICSTRKPGAQIERVAMGNGYVPAAPEKNPGPPARQSAVRGEDLIYISICSGGAIIKISAAERRNFILGQLIIFGIAIFVLTLVELTLWLAN
jgi:hypothetical protein